MLKFYCHIIDILICTYKKLNLIYIKIKSNSNKIQIILFFKIGHRIQNNQKVFEI